jgi:acyl-coenzyme A thioesterase PaaI-like protein
MELHIHFVGVVRLGEFVEARAEVVRATRSVVFLEAKMFVGDRLVLTTSGIWKIIGEP